MKMLKFLPILLFLVACNSLGSHSVCDVAQNPNDFRDANTISIKGVVTDSWDLFLVKYFILSDTKGACALAVQTDKILPEIGKEIVIKGHLSNTISYRDQTYVLVKEESK